MRKSVYYLTECSKRLFTTFTILACVISLAHADLWEDQVEETFEDSYSYGGETYDHGYQYRAGVGFARPAKARDIALVSEYDMGLGCGGFDLSLDFFNGLSEEALKDYVTGMGGEILKAAPLLLLEYISPTLADTLKHLKSQMREIQLLQYYKCQDIVDKGTNWIDKMRESSQQQQLKTAQLEGEGLSPTIEKITKLSPLEGKLDYNGKKLGTMFLVKDGLTWTETDDSLIELGSELTGDYEISYNKFTDKSEVNFLLAAKTTDVLQTENAEVFRKALEKALKYYDRTKKVKKSDLIKISLPSMPMDPSTIKKIGGMSKYDRAVSVNAYAQALALAKTCWQIDHIVGKLQQAGHNTNLDSGQRQKLAEFVGDLRNSKEDMRVTAELEDKIAVNKIGGILAQHEAKSIEAALKAEDSAVAEGIRKDREARRSPLTKGLCGLLPQPVK